MEQRLKLPVEIEFFDEIRTSGYYYIDKTKLIEQLLQNMGKVSLFTRPRRFGKTLNMSMLNAFLRSEPPLLCLTDFIFQTTKNCVIPIWGNIRLFFFH